MTAVYTTAALGRDGQPAGQAGIDVEQVAICVDADILNGVLEEDETNNRLCITPIG